MYSASRGRLFSFLIRFVGISNKKRIWHSSAVKHTYVSSNCVGSYRAVCWSVIFSLWRTPEQQWDAHLRMSKFVSNRYVIIHQLFISRAHCYTISLCLSEIARCILYRGWEGERGGGKIAHKYWSCHLHVRPPNGERFERTWLEK